MKKAFIIFALILTTQSLEGAIFGADNRRDISQIPLKWQKAAQAVAVALPKLYLEDLDEDHFWHSEFNERNYGETVGICKSEKFTSQTTFGHCSAFLIHPKIMVSAGHCFLPTGEVSNQAHDYCENFVFWLGYNSKEHPLSTIGSKILKSDVVTCKKVIYATNNEKMDPKNKPLDFAIYELEKPVLDRTHLSFAKRSLGVGEILATIGHPHGLPAKFSGLSPIKKVYSTTYTSYMDTLSGNSGGPVFNEKAKVVGILIAGHQHDTYQDGPCDRINRCSLSGKNCKMDTDLEESNLILRNDVWKPFIDQYLKKDL